MRACKNFGLGGGGGARRECGMRVSTCRSQGAELVSVGIMVIVCPSRSARYVSSGMSSGKLLQHGRGV